MPVSTTRKEYDDLLAEVQKNRAAAAGSSAIKKGGEKYLYPTKSMKLPCGNSWAEGGKEDYDSMLKRTLYLNAVGPTMDGFEGLVFMKPFELNAPPQLDYLKSNIDSEGTSLRKSMSTSLREGCVSPWSGVLVDHPEVEGQVSRAQKESLNIRPRILRFNFEQIINWDYSTVNNERKLSLVVLKETQSVKKSGDKFETEEKTFYRVLELIDGVYHFSSFEDETEIQEPTPALVNGSTVNEIPFYFIRSSGNRALLSDLVEVNINHYNMNASYTNAVYMSGFPIFTGTGISDKELPSGVGPSAFWYSQSPDANYAILEASGNVGGSRQYLEDRKVEMASLGAEQLSPYKMASETAESKRLDKQGRNSKLASLAIEVSEAYEKAYIFCARWMGASEDITLDLSTDFETNKLTPQERDSFMKLTQQGLYPVEALYSVLNKSGDLPKDMTLQEYKRALQEDFGEGAMPDVSGSTPILNESEE